MGKQVWMEEEIQQWQNDAENYEKGGRKGERRRRQKDVEDQQISDIVID